MTTNTKNNKANFNNIVGCLVRGIADSCGEEALRTDHGSVVDMNKACIQYEEYVNAMKSLNLELYEVPVDHKLPDCCFIEDTAVIHGGVAFICRPSFASRRPEVNDVIKALPALNLKIVQMDDDDATIEGGDVLFTGREFFVGVTSRTNMAGIKQLNKAFPDYQVTPIEMNSEYLHLKSVMSMAGPDVVAIGSSQHALDAKKQMMEKAVHEYRYVTLPDDSAANCLYVNGTLIHCTEEEYPASYKVYQEQFPDCPKISLPNSEFGKVDGAFTCRSIFIEKMDQ
ncbi:N(G),N(G)-dimethylarginine dimethylaminohydrolase 1-like [Anneissia japonica]|uniref:N(G),N(G)-dimethylarginine dimethylaminohydrolase 1-like n=1 Tax=Anneissia japonica TaxID=1529436 RepID=UPI0014254DB1|nr:N(G),N(G)-dimethylarginine dimethylaminohydrolase 1-like [Anneissia japonica]